MKVQTSACKTTYARKTFHYTRESDGQYDTFDIYYFSLTLFIHHLTLTISYTGKTPQLHSSCT